MYEIGQRVKGTVLNDALEDVAVEGAFLFRTDEPGENIQDVVIVDDGGDLIYIDEQFAEAA